MESRLGRPTLGVTAPGADPSDPPRFCRLIRLVRIVKVFRIKMMRDLRLMVKGAPSVVGKVQHATSLQAHQTC